MTTAMTTTTAQRTASNAAAVAVTSAVAVVHGSVRDSKAAGETVTDDQVRAGLLRAADRLVEATAGRLGAGAEWVDMAKTMARGFLGDCLAGDRDMLDVLDELGRRALDQRPAA